MESELLQDTADNSWTPRLTDSVSPALSTTIQFSGVSDVKTTGENIITHTKNQKKQLLHIVYLDSFIRHFPSNLSCLFSNSHKITHDR